MSEQAAVNRPTCANCGAEMLRDPAPRRQPRAPKGQQRIDWLCSFCWARRETLVPDGD